jgi:hypothetical protein
MKIGELKVNISIEPWATSVVSGMMGAIEKGLEAGMPPHVAQEIAEQVAKLAYTRAVKVKMPEMIVRFDGCVITRLPM